MSSVKRQAERLGLFDRQTDYYGHDDYRVDEPEADTLDQAEPNSDDAVSPRPQAPSPRD